MTYDHITVPQFMPRWVGSIPFNWSLKVFYMLQTCGEKSIEYGLVEKTHAFYERDVDGFMSVCKI